MLDKMKTALSKRGIIYTSFQYEMFEGDRNRRCFTDFTEESFEKFAKLTKGLQVKKMWITEDVRVGREQEKWLNIIMQKQIIFYKLMEYMRAHWM